MRKTKVDYEIGTLVWVYGSAEGKLTGGTIVHKFWLPSWHDTHYVIEIPTHIDPYLVVRQWHSISEDGKEINFWIRESA